MGVYKFFEFFFKVGWFEFGDLVFVGIFVEEFGVVFEGFVDFDDFVVDWGVDFVDCFDVFNFIENVVFVDFFVDFWKFDVGEVF